MGTTTNKNPRTGKWYSFPTDASRYVALVYRLTVTEYCCQYGHFGCAAWETGPCVAEVGAEYMTQDAAEARDGS